MTLLPPLSNDWHILNVCKIRKPQGMKEGTQGVGCWEQAHTPCYKGAPEVEPWLWDENEISDVSVPIPSSNEPLA